MDRTCAFEGCVKTPRSKGSALCAMHYHRQYRHGDARKMAWRSGVSVATPRLYRMRYLPLHPLAGKNGKVYEHRAVLYEAVGPGPHDCHWCGAEVDWLPRGSEGSLQVDHLNGDKGDNRAVNLVPSCCGCNVTRAAQQRSAALRAAGWWSENDTIGRLKSRRRRPRIIA